MKSRSLGLAVATGVLGAVASLLPGVLRLEENIGLDWLFLQRGPQAQPAEVAVVAIDSDSSEALDLHPDPARWSRSLHAELITRLVAAGAAVIAFDLSFDAPREGTQDAELAEAVGRAGNVLLLERLSMDELQLDGGAALVQVEQRTPPIERLERAALATAPFPLPVVPIKVSQFWVFGRAEDDVPTLPAVAVHAYARPVHEELIARIDVARPGAGERLLSVHSHPDPGALVRMMNALRTLFRSDPTLARELLSDLDTTTEPITGVTVAGWRPLLTALVGMLGGDDSRYLDYYGSARAVMTLSYHEVIADGWDSAASSLDGRVVFVGFSEPSAIDQQDTFYTPFSQSTGTNLSGVEIGATAVANMLQMRSVRPLSIPAHLSLVLVWGAALAALLLWLPVSLGLITAAVAGPAYLGVAHLQFDATGLWLPVIVPVLIQLPAAALLAVTLRYAGARAHGEQVGRTLRRYLPSWVTEDASRADGVGASTRVLYGTCLVTDADQYTALSERMSPEALHRLLNDYYAVLFREVERRGGFVADVVGDSMVAVWTSPTPDPAGHEAACTAALAILSSVEEFNAVEDRPDLPTRVGLHAGKVLLGDVGAGSHFEYRAVGDIVNTASRLQGLNKRLGTRALVSTTALRGTPDLAVRPLGRFLLAGKGASLDLNELRGLESSSAQAGELIGRFASALAAFVAQDWDRAEREFEALLERFPDDGPSHFYLVRCREFIASDPGPDWDGTISIEEK
ncbi:MAG: adenylate/guanylate cyclase domain-containing protein [Gammaproteobacteria bacterium]|nr:adenylate/guanylate cyclase domain-containing protein [Gammaproteobacteria bacterium]